MNATVIVLALIIVVGVAAFAWFYVRQQQALQAATQRQRGAGISSIARGVLGSVATYYTGGLALAGRQREEAAGL